MNMLEKIQSQGIKIFLHDGRLELQPLAKITPEIVADVKKYKAEIIQDLKSQNTGNQKKPIWCLFCEYHCYKQLDGRLTLFCNLELEAVYSLNKCPSGYWIKNEAGWPLTIN